MSGAETVQYLRKAEYLLQQAQSEGLQGGEFASLALCESATLQLQRAYRAHLGALADVYRLGAPDPQSPQELAERVGAKGQVCREAAELVELLECRGSWLAALAGAWAALWVRESAEKPVALIGSSAAPAQAEMLDAAQLTQIHKEFTQLAARQLEQLQEW